MLVVAAPKITVVVVVGRGVNVDATIITWRGGATIDVKEGLLFVIYDEPQAVIGG